MTLDGPHFHSITFKQHRPFRGGGEGVTLFLFGTYTDCWWDTLSLPQRDYLLPLLNNIGRFFGCPMYE